MEAASKYAQFKSKQVEVLRDNGRFPRGHIGIVLLATEQITESEAMKIVPEGIGIHFSRVEMETAVTVANLCAAGEELPAAAKRIVPGVKLGAIGYGCTSGSICIGEEYAIKQLLERRDVEKATTMVTGVIHALNALNVKRIAVATPYLDEINAAEAIYLESKSFEIINIQGMNLIDDFDIASVSPAFIKEYAKGVDAPEAEAVFISCSALRSVEIIEELEEEIGKPVVTSNQAFIWDLLRLAGIEDKVDGYGKLFRM